jgi:hypothetical protein
MRPKLLFAASVVALVLGFVSIAIFMGMYDLKPQSWGPQGVEFAEWHRLWSARRDLYVLLGTGAFAAAAALWMAGLYQLSRRLKGS